jgi:anti-sigma B factor antagonist
VAAQPSLPPAGHAPILPLAGNVYVRFPAVPLPRNPDPVPRDQEPMAATLLDLHVTASGGSTVVEAGGEIDVASAPELRECLHQTIDAGSRRLVVDLRQVSFIDSMGLGVLVGARRRLRDHGHDGSIQLVCADGLVLRVLRVSGLDHVFPLHATLTDALGDDPGQAEHRSGQGCG